MTYLCIKVPSEANKLLSDLEVPGSKTDSSDLHITLMYISKESTIEEVSKIFKISYEVLNDLKPFKINTSEVTFFDNGGVEKGYPVICKIESKELVELNAKLKKAFDKAEIEYMNNYKDYKPHITLSYSKDKPEEYSFDEVYFTVTEIELAGGSQEEDTVFVTFPLKKLEKKSNLLLKSELFEKLAYSIIN